MIPLLQISNVLTTINRVIVNEFASVQGILLKRYYLLALELVGLGRVRDWCTTPSAGRASILDMPPFSMALGIEFLLAEGVSLPQFDVVFY